VLHLDKFYTISSSDFCSHYLIWGDNRPLRPIQPRFHYASDRCLRLALTINSLDRSTKSTPSPDKRAPTPCTHTISGSISLPFRGSFNLSLTVLVLYRSQDIFSLGTWSSQLQSGFHVSRPTLHEMTDVIWWNIRTSPVISMTQSSTNIRLAMLYVPGFHRLWRNFPIPSARLANFLPYARHW